MVIKRDRNEKFNIERSSEFGGNVEYSTYEEIEKDFVEKKLHPQDVKNALAKEINALIKNFRDDKILHKLYKEAYG